MRSLLDSAWTVRFRCHRTGGGILIRPESVEFWQGRANRMHNRVRTSPGRRTVVRRPSPAVSPATRGHDSARESRLSTAVDGRHRHRHRRSAQRGRRTATGVRDHPKLGLRRSDGNLRSGPAGRFRSVGRRTGRRHGSTTAVDDHLDRTRRHVGAVLDPGCPERETTCGLVLGLFSVQQAFFAVNQPTRAAIIPRLIPGRQLPAANSLNMTVVQFVCDSRPATGGCPHTVGRSATAVPARLDLSSRHTVGGMEAPGDSADRNVSASRIERGPRRFHVSRDAEGSARVVRGGHHRDGVRDVASVVPGDRSRILR